MRHFKIEATSRGWRAPLNRMLSLPIAEAIDHAGGKFELAHFDVDLARWKQQLWTANIGMRRIHGCKFEIQILSELILESRGDVMLHHAQGHDVQVGIARANGRRIVGVTGPQRQLRRVAPEPER